MITVNPGKGANFTGLTDEQIMERYPLMWPGYANSPDIYVDGKPNEDGAARIAGMIPGWLFDHQGRMLYRYAAECPAGCVIVEIGSWKGRSTVFLGWGSKNGNGCPVYAVDHHKGSEELLDYPGFKTTPGGTYPEFWRNMQGAGLDDIVIPIVADSVAAAQSVDKPVGLLFVDGAHNSVAVRRDFAAWAPKVVKGGVIAFHDYESPFDVKAGVDSVLDGAWEKLGPIHQMQVARRK